MGVVREENASYVSAFFTGGKKAGRQKKNRHSARCACVLQTGEKERVKDDKGAGTRKKGDAQKHRLFVEGRRKTRLVPGQR